ncbi:histidine-rich glycoprotein [Musca domestica]|uniref:Histidine-rich glycoprotein n=1 Tax=Musca domestica TaxID=7370 RepID=A0A1I8MHB1_MUSDO|nr:histidine-rich glycoprotein [Musca domestica]
MMKFLVICSLLVATTAALKIHEYAEYKHEGEHGGEDTEVHHEVEHKHATSHQSVKFHHYHAVPVYIKKEDQHLVKKPVEIGGTKQKLKILHPETKKNHNHGLVLEEHSESKFHDIGHHEEEPEHHEHSAHYEQYYHHE